MFGFARATAAESWERGLAQASPVCLRNSAASGKCTKAPLAEHGKACTISDDCVQPLRCINGTCGEALRLGAACSGIDSCGAWCQQKSGEPKGVCKPWCGPFKQAP